MRKLVILLIFAPVISFGQIQSFFGEKFTVTETKDFIDNKDLINTKATSKQGDYVVLSSLGATDAWLVTEARGVWAKES